MTYIGTTAGNLDHYFGNYVAMARLFHVKDDPKPPKEAFEERKTKFIEGLENTIARNLPMYGGITQEHLREIVQLAQGDWSDVKTIKALYRRVYELTNDEFDEQKLFPERS